MTPSAPKRCSQASTATAPTTAPSTCSPEGTPPVPDATGLELTAHELRDRNAESILDTNFHRGRAELRIHPAHVVDVLDALRTMGYTFLASLHGVDYYPEEPRLGVVYEMLNMHDVDRISVKARLHTDDPRIASVMGILPGAAFPERAIYDMFGVAFDGSPDVDRVLTHTDF